MKTTESIVIDGYDLLGENDRLAFDDAVVGGRKLNRGTAVVSPAGTAHGDYADVKAEHRRQIFPNTIEDASPVIDYSYPATGMFVDSPAGVYLDLYQGVAQKLVDDHHIGIFHGEKITAKHRTYLNSDPKGNVILYKQVPH